jgi:hypothetical protein
VKLRLVACALAAFLFGGNAALAQSVMVGATYSCPGIKIVLESCDETWCTLQYLNDAAANGRGAKLQVYRSGIAEQMANCTPSGGTPLDVSPAARARPSAAPSNPAYRAGAGAGVTTRGGGDYRAGYGAGVKINPPGAAKAPAARLVSNSYYCTAYIGTPPGGHMATMPGFTISGSTYRHQNGSSGTVSVSGGTLEFHGGALDGQAATYDGGATGRGTVHLYNQSRSRTVIDCDGHS